MKEKSESVEQLLNTRQMMTPSEFESIASTSSSHSEMAKIYACVKYMYLYIIVATFCVSTTIDAHSLVATPITAIPFARAPVSIPPVPLVQRESNMCFQG